MTPVVGSLKVAMWANQIHALNSTRISHMWHDLPNDEWGKETIPNCRPYSVALKTAFRLLVSMPFCPSRHLRCPSPRGFYARLIAASDSLRSFSRSGRAGDPLLVQCVLDDGASVTVIRDITAVARADGDLDIRVVPTDDNPDYQI